MLSVNRFFFTKSWSREKAGLPPQVCMSVHTLLLLWFSFLSLFHWNIFYLGPHTMICFLQFYSVCPPNGVLLMKLTEVVHAAGCESKNTEMALCLLCSAFGAFSHDLQFHVCRCWVGVCGCSCVNVQKAPNLRRNTVGHVKWPTLWIPVSRRCCLSNYMPLL